MVQLLIKIPGNGADYKEWAMIELQGALESRTKESMHAKFIGDLHFSPDGVPMLIIGHHILYGKMVTMDKPFAVLTKNSQESPDESMDSHPDAAPAAMATDEDAQYLVKAIIKKKLIFKTRPKPIIVNLPKKA